MEKSVGSLQEQALKRKERLKALRDKQLHGRDQEDGEPENKKATLEEPTEEKHRELKLRNYTPEDEELKGKQVPKAKPASVEDKVKDQLEAANPEPIIEEVDLANLAPRKPDWDLKRDVAKKLEKLERRTQRAIAELISDVRSLSLPGTFEEKIRHLGKALNNFVRLKSLDLSCNALVSVQGVQHLKMLERLILYNNCIPSLEEVEVLFELKALKELDLRLNPLTKNYPHYRPYLVHAMPSLRKLDSCSVRDTERKAAILQFSSDILPQQKSSSLNPTEDQRSSNQRLALVNRLTKRLSLLTDSQDIVLNFVETNLRGQSETVSFHKEAEELKDSEDFTHQRSSTPKQETAKSILRYPPTKNADNTESRGPQVKEPSHNKTSTSAKVSERPKVSFGPYIEKPVSGKQKQKDSSKQTKHAAKGHFTPNPDQSQRLSSSFSNIRPPSPRRPGLNLSDPSNPILHPPRLTYSSFNKTEEGSSLLQQGDKKKRGSYRKPLEMLLNLVDRHWTGERSLHHNNNFLSQAVQILSMMESDISSREAEVRTLRREADALSFQVAAREEEHKSEVRNLSAQLEEARRAVGTLNEQLRIVLEENVALQKQLIKLERQYLKSMMKSSPIAQIREAQTEVEELRKEIEGLRKKVQEAENVKELSNMLQESHRSLVATNECLLAELKGSGEH